MTLPGTLFTNHCRMAPGYSLRLLNDEGVLICFGSEEIVAWCHPMVRVRTVEWAIEDHQAARLDEAARLAPLLEPRRAIQNPWTLMWRFSGLGYDRAL